MRYQEDMTPGEWERDSMGRKFRRVGKGRIEYAPTISLAGGIEIYEDELSDYHKRQKAAEEEQRKKQAEAFKNAPPVRSCPFINGCNTTCRRDACKIFIDGRCAISIIADAAGVEITQAPPKNAKCPFSTYGHCESCALYNKGCGIARIATAQIKNNEIEV